MPGGGIETKERRRNVEAPGKGRVYTELQGEAVKEMRGGGTTQEERRGTENKQVEKELKRSEMYKVTESAKKGQQHRGAG